MRLSGFSLAILILVGFAQAETLTVGRTEDGTPYRIDSQGLKITDHIAELEVTIAELRREIAQLEEERLPKAEPILSKDLMQPASPRTGSDSTKAAVTMLRNKIASCQSDRLELARDAQVLASEKRALQEKLQSVRASASKSREKVQSGQKAANQQVAVLEAEVIRLTEALNSKNSDSRKLEELETENQRLAGLIEELRKNNIQLAKSQTTQVARAQARSSQDLRRARLANRSELNASFNKIRGLIQQRKTLLDRALVRDPGARRYLSPLVSSRGRSLDALRAGMQRPAQNAGLIAELEEIEDVLKADISKIASL